MFYFIMLNSVSNVVILEDWLNKLFKIIEQMILE